MNIYGIAHGPAMHGGVTWFALKTSIDLSAEQMDAFAELYPHDARPLQPLNGRVGKESQTKNLYFATVSAEDSPIMAKLPSLGLART